MQPSPRAFLTTLRIAPWLEWVLVLGILLMAAWLRLSGVVGAPLGFTAAELDNIQITHAIYEGQVQVFFENPVTEGGQEGFYAALNALVTLGVGDGSLGYRMLGTWAQLLALAFLYRLTRRLFNVPIALIALVLMSASISMLLLARSVTAVTMMPLFVTMTLAVMAWAFHLHLPYPTPAPRTLPFTLLGFLIGGAIYTHPLGWLLLLLLLLFVAYLWLTQQPVSPLLWSSSLFTVTLVIVLLLPYIISVLRNTESSGAYIIWRDRPRGLEELPLSLLKTLGAFFVRGDSDVGFNVPGLPLVLPFWSVLILVGLFAVWQRWRRPRNALLLLTLGVGLLPDIWLRDGPNFKALVMVQPALFMFAGIGVIVTLRFVQQFLADYPAMRVLRWGALLLVAVGLLWTLWQGYQQVGLRWIERQDVQEAYHMHLARLAYYLDSTEDDTPSIICSSRVKQNLLSSNDPLPPDPVIMKDMLHREDLNLRYADCRSSFVFIGAGEPMRVLWANLGDLAELRAPLQNWIQEATVVPADNLATGTLLHLESTDQIAAKGGQLQLFSQLFYPRMAPGALEPVALPVRFGRNVTLLGYEANLQEQYQPGDVIPISSYWRIEGSSPLHLGAFTRLHDAPQSSPYAEVNGLDLLVEDLQARDVVLQVHYLTIPPNLLPGNYGITLGIYDNNPLNQIPVFNAEATEVRGTYLILQQRFRVEAEADAAD